MAAPESPPAIVPKAPKKAQRQPTRSPPALGPSKPKAQEKPPGWVCAQISFGLNTVGRDRVIQEGAKRGYSTSQTNSAIKACGY